MTTAELRDRLAVLMGWEKLASFSGWVRAEYRHVRVIVDRQDDPPIPATIDGLLAMWPKDRPLTLDMHVLTDSDGRRRPKWIAFGGESGFHDGDNPYDALLRLLVAVLEAEKARAVPTDGREGEFKRV